MFCCPPVPVSCPEYSPLINYDSDLFGKKTSFNKDFKCNPQDKSGYPYIEQDHLALRHLAFKNFVRPRTLDGKTIHKQIDERQYNCSCNIPTPPWTAKFNSEALKFEIKNGVLKRGCDCIKRNGLQDECPRVRHKNRWQSYKGSSSNCDDILSRLEENPHNSNTLHHHQALRGMSCTLLDNANDLQRDYSRLPTLSSRNASGDDKQKSCDAYTVKPTPLSTPNLSLKFCNNPPKTCKVCQ